MSYVLVATAQGPTVTSKPDVVRDFAAGLAGASHYTRNRRDESMEIFAQWVPNTDVAVGKKAIRHISYDRRALTCRISSAPRSWLRWRRSIRNISPTCPR